MNNPHQNLAKIITARASRRGGSISVSTDSRAVNPGDCFFAITGANFDGHSFVSQAIKKGAVCAVVNRNIKLPDADEKFLLRVDDTVEALGCLAVHYRTKSKFKVIAITGSVGKTTTRHIIAHVLKSRHRVYQSPKNFNNQIGVPLTLLAAKADDEFIIAELGTNRPGEIEYLSKITRPDFAIVTNVRPAHLEGLGSLDAITREKLSIATGLAPAGRLFINGDCSNLVAAARENGYQFTTFGLDQTCDVHPQTSDWNHKCSEFTIDSVSVNIPLGGKGNLENALAAWSVCSELGFTAQQFADAVKSIPPVDMRAHIRRFGSIEVIDDCYNANPASMKNALELLSKMAASEKRRPVFVCGDMGELGEHSRKYHEELAGDIINANVPLVITTGPMSALAASTAKTIAAYKLEIENFPDANAAADNLHKFIKDYDIVLVKGSRNAALEIVVHKLQQCFIDSPLPGPDKS
ncbi:MAG: UDP-N-acetylmuramoyl-tripeptide--D-alanyl-D-alanine ligase [Phycisphaerae bacterium]|jgi:UDP-N-acetylmuramoyl-tripeptide--D-alanyl-D-alanine ligase